MKLTSTLTLFMVLAITTGMADEKSFRNSLAVEAEKQQSEEKAWYQNSIRDAVKARTGVDLLKRGGKTVMVETVMPSDPGSQATGRFKVKQWAVRLGSLLFYIESKNYEGTQMIYAHTVYCMRGDGEVGIFASAEQLLNFIGDGEPTKLAKGKNRVAANGSPIVCRSRDAPGSCLTYPYSIDYCTCRD